MRFDDFLNKCMENPEFKKYWEEDADDADFSQSAKASIPDALSVAEALSLLETEDFQAIITNKGIKKNVERATEIIFFEKGGDCPVAEFLSSIEDTKLLEKTLRSIYELAMVGNKARMPLSRHIDGGIFELRSKQGSNITRIFYFFIFGNNIIMTNGYVKKDQNLEKSELKKAKRYMKEYLDDAGLSGK